MTDALRLLHLQGGLVLRTEIRTRVHRRIDLPEGRVHDGQQVQAGELACNTLSEYLSSGSLMSRPLRPSIAISSAIT